MSGQTCPVLLSLDWLQVTLPLVWCWLLVCYILLLLWLGLGLEFLIFPWLLSWKDVEFCEILSQKSNEMIIWFFLAFVYVVVYIDEFLYIKPSLHTWDEAYLTMLDNHFDVFLDSVSKNFIEHFCINIHNGNWSKVLLVEFCKV